MGKEFHLKQGDKITLQNNNSSQQYLIKKKINKGGQAQVYNCVKLNGQNQSRDEFAIKVFEEQLNSKYLEAKGFIPKNKYILRYYYFGIAVMEKCKCNLKQYLQQKGKEKRKSPGQQGSEIVRQILRGYKSLIDYGVVHRDLKPQNILFNKGVWKIGDFGLSKFYFEKSNTKLGTQGYQSPEAKLGGEHTSKCDVYSSGILFYEMLYGELPWPKDSNLDPNQQVNFNQGLLSKELENFIKQCLGYKEAKRLSWEEVYNYSMFKSEFYTNVKQIRMIDELNQLKNWVSLNILSINNQMSLQDFLANFKAHSEYFSRMKLIIAYCLFEIQNFFSEEYKNQKQTVDLPISQTQMAQNGYLACILTFYMSQIHQLKDSAVFFKGQNISKVSYLHVLRTIDKSIREEDDKMSFELLQKNDMILHRDFLELFQFDFLK